MSVNKEQCTVLKEKKEDRIRVSYSKDDRFPAKTPGMDYRQWKNHKDTKHTETSIRIDPRRHYKTRTNEQVHINTDKWLMEQGADPIEIIQTTYIQGFARAIKRLSRPEKEYLPALKATMW